MIYMVCSIYELCIGSIYVAYMRDHIYYICVFLHICSYVIFFKVLFLCL